MAMRTASGSTSPIEGSSCRARRTRSRASGINGLSFVSKLNGVGPVPMQHQTPRAIRARVDYGGADHTAQAGGDRGREHQEPHLLNRRLATFSSERLMRLLTALGQDVKITLG